MVGSFGPPEPLNFIIWSPDKPMVIVCVVVRVIVEVSVTAVVSVRV